MTNNDIFLGIRKYHSQYYVNGSTCDLTGELRKTEVTID